MICHNFTNSKCIRDRDKSKIISASEKGKTFKIVNKSEKNFLKLLVDDCLIKNHDIRCDYLFLNCDDDIAYFLELKGRNINHAIEQLSNSIDLIKPQFNSFKSINSYIVLSKVNTPDVNSSKMIKFRKKLQNLNGELVYKEKKLEIQV